MVDLTAGFGESSNNNSTLANTDNDEEDNNNSNEVEEIDLTEGFESFVASQNDTSEEETSADSNPFTAITEAAGADELSTDFFAETSIENPPVGSDMYRKSGMTVGQAKELYEWYKSQPTSTITALGDLNYTDPDSGITYRVPKPVFTTPIGTIPFAETFQGVADAILPGVTDDLLADTDFVPRTINAVGGALRETVEFGGAVVDIVTNKTFLPDADLSSNVTSQEVLTKILPKESYGSSIGDALLTELPVLIGTFFLGSGGVTTLTNGAKELTEKALKSKIISNWNKTKIGKFSTAVTKEINPLNNRLVQISPLKVAQFLAGDAAVAAVLPTDTKTLLFGGDDQALFGLPDAVDFSFKPGDKEYEKILAARGNIFLDGLIAAGILKTGLEGATKAATYLGKITAFPFLQLLAPQADPLELLGIEILEGNKKEIVRNALLELVYARPGTTLEEAAKISKQIAEAMVANKQAFIDFGKDGGAPIDVVLTAMGALTRAENIDDFIKAKAVKLEQGIVSQQSNIGTEAARANISLALESKLNELTGDAVTRIGRGADEMRKMADSLTYGEEYAVALNKQNLANIDKTLNDTFFSENADELAALLKLDPTAVSTAKGENRDMIISLLKLQYKQDKNKRNELFNAVKGGNIKDDAWIKSLSKEIDKLKPSQFDQAFNDMPQSPFTKFMEALRRRETPVLDDAGKPIKVNGKVKMELESVAERNERVKALFAGEGMDYGFVFNTVRQDARKLANDFNPASTLNPKGNKAIFSALVGLVNWIDGKGLDIVVKNSGEEGALIKKNAKAALDWTAKEFSRNWRDGGLKEFADVFDNTIGRSRTVTNKGVPIKEENIVLFNEAEFGKKSKEIIEAIIKSGGTDNTSQLVKVLESQQAGSSSNVLEYIIQDSLAPMFTAFRKGGVDNFNIDQFENTLIKYGQVLKDNFPDAEQQLSAYANRIRDAKGNKIEIEKIVNESEKTLEALQDRVLSSELGNFLQKNAFGQPNREALSSSEFAPFSNEFSTGVTTTNGFEAFKKILNSEMTARDVVADILSKAKDQGTELIIRDAMQTVFLKDLKDKIIGKSSQSIGDNKAINQAKIIQSEDATKQFMLLGEDLFSNKPEVFAALQETIDIGDRINKNMQAKPVRIESGTNYLKETKAAANKIIYFTMGVLSEAGTKARVIASTLDNRARRVSTKYAQTVDIVFSNADEFGRIAMEITRKGFLTPKIKSDIKKNLLKGYFFIDDDDSNTPTLTEQTEELLQSEDIPYVPFI